MEYMRLDPDQRQAFLAALGSMPDYLHETFAGLGAEQTRTAGPDGLVAFAEARRRNLAALRGLDSASWYRTGTQEGIGKVSLCDIPGFMSQHDAAHRREIDAWIRTKR